MIFNSWCEIFEYICGLLFEIIVVMDIIMIDITIKTVVILEYRLPGKSHVQNLLATLGNTNIG